MCTLDREQDMLDDGKADKLTMEYHDPAPRLVTVPEPVLDTDSSSESEIKTNMISKSLHSKVK
jgi:hypothetical protein